MIARGLVTASLFLLSSASAAHAQQTFMLMPVQGGLSTVSDSSTGTTTVDLLIEAETYAPYFYSGRREPVAGNTVKLTAILPLGGQATSFQWRLGNQGLTTTSPNASFVLPNVAGEVLATVVALDAAGRKLGSASEYVRPSSPRVMFYETNDLRGASRVAIGESLVLIGSELGVKAEPYFFGTRALLSGSFGSWSGKGIDVVVGDDWRFASFVRQETGAATEGIINFNISSRDNLSETVAGSFNLSL